MSALRLTLNLGSHSTKEFQYPVGTELKSCDLKVLHEHLLQLQKESNDVISVVVNEEKSLQAEKNQKNGKLAADEDDDDEDDEDDGEVGDGEEPNHKKIKL